MKWETLPSVCSSARRTVTAPRVACACARKARLASTAGRNAGSSTGDTRGATKGSPLLVIHFAAGCCKSDPRQIQAPKSPVPPRDLPFRGGWATVRATEIWLPAVIKYKVKAQGAPEVRFAPKLARHVVAPDRLAPRSPPRLIPRRPRPAAAVPPAPLAYETSAFELAPQLQPKDQPWRARDLKSAILERVAREKQRREVEVYYYRIGYTMSFPLPLAQRPSLKELPAAFRAALIPGSSGCRGTWRSAGGCCTSPGGSSATVKRAPCSSGNWRPCPAGTTSARWMATSGW